MDYLVEQLRYQLREDPSSRVFFKLGEHLRREGELDEAVTVLRSGLEHHPSYVAAWVSLGRSLLDAGAGAEAAEALAHASQLDPENAVAARFAGEAAIANADWVGAIKALKRARALSGADDVLDERILFVEQQLAEVGQLEIPDPEMKRAAPPTPALGGEDDQVFSVEDSGAAHAAPSEADVFAAEDVADETDPSEMDSRATAAIPIAELQIPSPPEPPEPELPEAAQTESVFDLEPAAPYRDESEPIFEADETEAGEGETVFEEALASEPDSVVETLPGEPFAAVEPDRDQAETVFAPADDSQTDAEAPPEPDSEAETVFLGDLQPEPAPGGASEEEKEEEEEGSIRRSEELPLPTMTLARLALEQGDLELAEKTLRGVLARNPEHSEAAALLAKLGEGADGASASGAAGLEGGGDARVEALRRWLDAVRLASERLKT